MTDQLTLFENQRRQMLRVATRILRSSTDAEDVVQEAWFRWQKTDPADISSCPAFLTTMITRLALDRLRRAVNQEVPLELWALPPSPGDDPAVTVEVAEAVTSALTLLLQDLSPLERTALVLRDVFQWPYSTVSRRLGRSEQAVRQLVHRARRRIAASRKPAGVARHPAIEAHFHRACTTGDVEPLLAALAPDIPRAG